MARKTETLPPAKRMTVTLPPAVVRGLLDEQHRRRLTGESITLAGIIGERLEQAYSRQGG